MKYLIIYAHPDAGKPSHASTTLEEVEKTLKARNESYEVCDLYKMKFQPLLMPEDMQRDAKPEPVVEDFRKKIKECETIIFIYPVWWSSMPAILKGWCDRVFASGFAFRYVDKFPSKIIGVKIPEKLLVGKKAIIFTSLGTRSFFEWFFLGNRYKKIMGNDILWFCGIRSKFYLVDRAFALTDRNIAIIKKNVKKALG